MDTDVGSVDIGSVGIGSVLVNPGRGYPAHMGRMAVR
jgi:hypothetical protein